MKFKLFFLILLLLSIPLIGVSDIPGKYDLIIPHVPPKAHSLDQVIIGEVFAFDCIHCFCLNKKLTEDVDKICGRKRNGLVELKEMFGDKIKINYLPIGWRGHDPGRLFFIAEEKGKGHEVMMMIFSFIFEKGIGHGVFERDKLQFVARLNGLSKEFRTQMDDPRIIKKMNASVQFSKIKKINSTPTLVIEGSLMPERDFSNLVTIINALLKEPVK